MNLLTTIDSFGRIVANSDGDLKRAGETLSEIISTML